jgi:hypothetical protein
MWSEVGRPETEVKKSIKPKAGVRTLIKAFWEVISPDSRLLSFTTRFPLKLQLNLIFK